MSDFFFSFWVSLRGHFCHQKGKKNVPTDRPYLEGLSARKTGFIFFLALSIFTAQICAWYKLLQKQQYTQKDILAKPRNKSWSMINPFMCARRLNGLKGLVVVCNTRRMIYLMYYYSSFNFLSTNTQCKNTSVLLLTVYMVPWICWHGAHQIKTVVWSTGSHFVCC